MHLASFMLFVVYTLLVLFFIAGGFFMMQTVNGKKVVGVIDYDLAYCEDYLLPCIINASAKIILCGLILYFRFILPSLYDGLKSSHILTNVRNTLLFAFRIYD